MSYLVDTSALIERGAADVDDWAVSFITIGELRAGALLISDARTRARRLRLLEAVVAEVPALPVDDAVASRYAELRALVGREPSNDLWIGATAMAHGLTLVTADRGMAKLPMATMLIT